MRSPSTLTRTIQINTAKTVSSQQKGHPHSNTELRLGHPFSPLVPAAFLLSPSLSLLPSPFFLAANIQKKQAFTLLARNDNLILQFQSYTIKLCSMICPKINNYVSGTQHESQVGVGVFSLFRVCVQVSD